MRLFRSNKNRVLVQYYWLHNLKPAGLILYRVSRDSQSGTRNEKLICPGGGFINITITQSNNQHLIEKKSEKKINSNSLT